jgi:hypothetical protein
MAALHGVRSHCARMQQQSRTKALYLDPHHQHPDLRRAVSLLARQWSQSDRRRYYPEEASHPLDIRPASHLHSTRRNVHLQWCRRVASHLLGLYPAILRPCQCTSIHLRWSREGVFHLISIHLGSHLHCKCRSIRRRLQRVAAFHLTGAHLVSHPP